MDLFDNYDQQPPKLAAVCMKYLSQVESGERDLYMINKEFLGQVKELGFSFDYGLDGQPYNLRQIEK